MKLKWKNNMDEDRAHAGRAAVLSFIFSGLGQLYNGQIKKGLLIILVSCLSMLIFIIGAIIIGFWILGKAVSTTQIISGIILLCSGLIFICILGIWNIFDAYNTAQKSR